MARVLLTTIAPAYGRLCDEAPSRVLDVGTGVGAIATTLAQALPATEIVGIDIAERPLAIARDLLRAADPKVAARILLRHEDVTRLSEKARFDLVWMPLPFLPDSIVDQALDRVLRALRPGGLLVLGALPSIDDERSRAATAWLASLSGGGTLTADDAVNRLARRGLQQIERFATVPGAPVLVAALLPDAAPRG